MEHFWGVCVDEGDTTNLKEGKKYILQGKDPSSTHYFVFRDLGFGHCGMYQAKHFRLTGELTQEELDIHEHRKKKSHEDLLKSIEQADPRTKKMLNWMDELEAVMIPEQFEELQKAQKPKKPDKPKPKIKQNRLF